MTASAATHPLDVLKVRLQLRGEMDGSVKKGGIISETRSILRTCGIAGLYPGLTATLFRQATYSTSRLGVYGYVKDHLVQFHGSSDLPFSLKLVAGVCGGTVGAICGTPADVLLVRMQSDARLPVEQRRGYKNVFDGLIKVVRHEGAPKLWTGVLPNTVRAQLMSASQLGTYDQVKESLIHTGYFKDGILCHFAASCISGFVATAVTNPVDVVKTRLMNAKKGSTMYTGALDCATKLWRAEGLAGFYKGFLPSLMRLGPNTVLLLMCFEQYEDRKSVV